MTDLDTLSRPPADLAALQDKAAHAARLLKALSNERRLLILCRLGAGEASVGALQAELGVSQSALSQHLAVLREDGLVATRREAQTIHYRIADPAALTLIGVLVDLYCPDIAP